MFDLHRIGDSSAKKQQLDASGLYVKEYVPLSYFAKTVNIFFNMIDDSDEEVKYENED